ncbi:hypothetical protein ACS0TY_022871 [Phlomoides rotata]
MLFDTLLIGTDILQNYKCILVNSSNNPYVPFPIYKPTIATQLHAAINYFRRTRRHLPTRRYRVFPTKPPSRESGGCSQVTPHAIGSTVVELSGIDSRIGDPIYYARRYAVPTTADAAAAAAHDVSPLSEGPSCIFVGPIETASQETLEALFRQAREAYYSGEPLIVDDMFDRVEDSFFYGHDFNKHITMCLLNFLVKERNEVATVHKRVRILKKRWSTFTDMLSLSGVIWDSGRNMMFVPPELWTNVLMSNRLARAYQYEGDPQYELLQTLFNDPGVAGEFLPAMDADDIEQDDE